MKKKEILVLIGIMTMVLLMNKAYGQTLPIGPDTLNVFNASTYVDTNPNGTLVMAEAGNVTGITMNFVRSTLSWAGFYGNVTGTIVLSDSASNYLYDWKISNPLGQVFASNSTSVSWSQVKCVNFTGDVAGGFGPLEDPFNASTLESAHHMNSTDVDGFNETFNETYNDGNGLFIGRNINSSLNCPMAYTFSNSDYQTVNFKEILLTDNYSIIFTSLINSTANGFRTGVDPNDFQMLVSEDGHPEGAATLTNYYFFVQLS